MRGLVVLILSMVFPVLAHAQSRSVADIQIGLSNDTVAITSNFDGTNIVVFGSIEGGDLELLKEKRYDIVVTLAGPSSNLIVRRKERKFGIWVNGAAHEFSDVPASYSIATTRPIDQISDARNLKILQIGFDNLNFLPLGEESAPEEVEEFRQSLVRLKNSQGLFLERIGGIRFLSPTLFKASLAVPANVPIGYHRARANLFADGKFITTRSVLLNVQKQGFEQQAYDLAHRNGVLYGVLAVILAMATGWLASVIFRKD